MSPYTSGSRTFSVTDRRLITDLSTAPYDQKDLCVFCRTTLLWSRWQQNTAGSLKRPNQRRRQRGGGGQGASIPRIKFWPPNQDPSSIKILQKTTGTMVLYNITSCRTHNLRERLCNNNRGPHSYLLTFSEFDNLILLILLLLLNGIAAQIAN